nr:single-stranded DNA-binding protein [uncultured Oribacterium sp.]
MNQVVLIGRLVKDPEIRYTQGEQPIAVANYTLAVDRRYKKDGEPSADFIRCVAFGRNAEFAEKFMTKGRKFAVAGSIQTGSYQNKDGQTVYTTDVIINGQEFCDSKPASAGSSGNYAGAATDSEGFMSIPDGVEDEGLPFN